MVEAATPNASLGVREALDKLRSAGINQAFDVDPVLAAALGVPRDSTPRETYDLVRRGLFTYSDRLSPAKLRTAFLEAAGFRQNSPASAGDRIRAAAEVLGISQRSAYRLVKKAVDQLATNMASESERCRVQGIDYVFLKSHVRVDLEGKKPGIVTQRTISARIDGVDRIEDRVAFPLLTGSELDLRAIDECELDDCSLVEPGMWSIRLKLPRPLALGEPHSFAVSVVLPDHESLEPVIGFLPHTDSYEASVEFRFGQRLPVRFDEFDGETPNPATMRPRVTREVPPIGRRQTFKFPEMRRGLCYGVRWHWPTDAETAAAQ